MQIRVQGGQPLNGTYVPQGNPNAAKALLAASMLSTEPSKIRRMPRNTSTMNLIDAATQLGATVRWDTPHTLKIETSNLQSRTLDETIIGGAVGALLFLAPMLAQRDHIRLEPSFPLNRIRTHLDAMRDLGLGVVVVSGAVEVRAAHWQSRDIILNSPSVTATAITLMLSVIFGQETIIRNAASEPHITDLANMLNRMGADVVGIGSNVLMIHGGKPLGGTEAVVSYDHIEMASIAAIVALSGGRVQITSENGGSLPDMRPIARTFSQFGLSLDADANAVLVPRHERLAVTTREENIDASVETAPYPGFPSDLVTIAAVIATQAYGTSLIHEKLFRDRLLFVDTLKDMGANIVLADPHRAIIVGASQLHSTYIPTPDPRFGLGLLGAALIAEGETVIDNAHRFDYTFEGVLDKLRDLNAIIAKVKS